MRTLLDGIKGELFALARDNDKQNMTWETMADKLNKGHEGGSDRTEVLNQEVIRSKLIDDLSKTLKDREGKIPVSIEDLWTRTIDHLYVLLNSIKTNA